VDRVLAEWKPMKLGLMERLYEKTTLWRIRVSRLRKRRQGSLK
jgi:hypothetical protein